MAISRGFFTDTIKSINGDLKSYGELMGGKHSKVSRAILSGDSFRERRERALIIRELRAINKEARETDFNLSMCNSSQENAEIYDKENQNISTHISNLEGKLGGRAGFRTDLELVVDKIEDELRLRASLMRDAREVRNENLQLNNLIANPLLIRERPVLNFTKDKLNQLIKLENKYYQDSPVDFRRLEQMVTLNENLLKEVNRLYKHRWGMKEIMERLDKESASKLTVDVGHEPSNTGVKREKAKQQPITR